MPRNIAFSQNDGGAASANVGPGVLSELSGNLSISKTDADATSALGNLDVARTLTTLHPATATSDADGVFGPAWTADFPAASGGAAELSVTDSSARHYVSFTSSGGAVTTYIDAQSKIDYPMVFLASGDDAGNDSVVTKTDASTISMTETDGTKTTWAKTGSPATWQVTSVAAPGSNATTS